MQVSVEESGVIERKVTISIPHTEVDQEVEKRLRNMAKKARIPGFRPGKAPQNIVNKHYGAQVTDEVVNDTIHSSYREALGEQSMVPASLLSIEPKPFVSGGDLEYVATIELFPEIPSPTLAGCALEKPVCAVVAEDVGDTLQRIRERNAEFTPAGRKAAKGDRLTIDFVGTIADQPFPGGNVTDHQFTLGEGYMPEPFERGLLGTTVGAPKSIKVTFPKEHPEEVAGKTAHYAVTVKAVEVPVLPELDGAFATKLGIKGGLKKMRAEIETSLQRELATRMRIVLRDRVMKALLQANKIEAPKALVEAEIDRRMEAASTRTPTQVVPAQEITREGFAAEAKTIVILGLVVNEIIEKSKIKVDGDAVRARIEEMATSYDDATAVIDWHYADPKRLRVIEGEVLEEQMVAHLLETADVTEKKVSFQELMNL